MVRKDRQSWTRYPMDARLLKSAREGDVKEFVQLVEREETNFNRSMDEVGAGVISKDDGVKLEEGAAAARPIIIPGIDISVLVPLPVATCDAEDITQVLPPESSGMQVKQDTTTADEPRHDRLRSLLLRGATADGDGVLHIAARHGNEQLVRAVLRKARVLPAHPDLQPAGVAAAAAAAAAEGDADKPTNITAAATSNTCSAAAANAAAATESSAATEFDEAQTVRFADFLRARNHRGETCLHDAVRCGDTKLVKLLIMTDAILNDETSPALVQIVDEDGVSPLYLATTLRRTAIVKRLTKRTRYPASYAGPGGKTALHAAVLVCRDVSTQLLEWNSDLINMADESGSTPLHFLGSHGSADIAKLLLEEDSDSALWPDSKGSLPIHLAAANGRLDMIKQLLQFCPDCMWSLDASGQTFLHVAVLKRQQRVVKHVCREKKFERILNTRDEAGDTALHSAVRKGNQWVFLSLMRNKHVCLSLTNRKGHTPLDLAVLSLPSGLRYRQIPRNWILYDLAVAGADLGTYRWDHFRSNIKGVDKEKLSKAVSKSAGLVAVCAVLILNIAFAAPFNVAKFYSDSGEASTRRSRARAHAFRAFVVSDTLAFLFSVAATFCCSFAGFSIMDGRTRRGYLNVGNSCLVLAALSMVAVFMLGMYVVVAPIDLRIAIVACVFALLAVVILRATHVVMMLHHVCALLRRLGFREWCRAFRRSRRRRDLFPFQCAGLVHNSLSVFIYILLVCLAITGFSYL